MPVKLKPRSDGRYSIRYKDKYFYGSTQREVLRKRDEYIAKTEVFVSTTDDTVAEYAARWLPVAKADTQKKTYNDYANLLDKLCDTIGNKPISEVTPFDIKSVYAEHFLDMSNSTIRRARQLYVSLFNSAYENGAIRINPCLQKTAQPHKGESGTHRVITEHERSLILSTEHRFQVPALIMLYAGLRRGEVLALKRSDIDLDRNVIIVRKAIRYDGNKPVQDTPKTKAGVREVPILNTLRPFLEHLTRERVCESVDGKIMTSTAFTRAWNSYLVALSDASNGFTKRWRNGREYVPISIRTHDLRHSYATMLRDSGIDMKLAMKWMGHADEKMILKIYDHVTDNRIAKAVEILNANF